MVVFAILQTIYQTPQKFQIYVSRGIDCRLSLPFCITLNRLRIFINLVLAVYKCTINIVLIYYDNNIDKSVPFHNHLLRFYIVCLSLSLCIQGKGKSLQKRDIMLIYILKFI